jgi:membrane protein implicated in regulation of membrane protease activity
MGGSLARMVYLVSSLVVLVVLVYLGVLDPQAAIVVFLLMLVVLAYIRRRERLPYRELTDNIF